MNINIFIMWMLLPAAAVTLIGVEHLRKRLFADQFPSDECPVEGKQIRFMVNRVGKSLFSSIFFLNTAFLSEGKPLSVQ